MAPTKDTERGRAVATLLPAREVVTFVPTALPRSCVAAVDAQFIIALCARARRKLSNAQTSTSDHRHVLLVVHSWEWAKKERGTCPLRHKTLGIATTNNDSGRQHLNQSFNTVIACTTSFNAFVQFCNVHGCGCGYSEFRAAALETK